MDVSSQNPWWNTQGLWQDPDLTKVKNSKLQYHPRPILSKECKTPGIVTLRGPRRAGKTVALKLLIANLIENQGWDGRKICWTSFETFRNLSQLEEHLLSLPKSLRALFIDEATSVVGWQRVIKKLVDAGVFQNTFIAVTGSSAFDLKKSAERMAGRRGTHANPDRVLLPMGFLEFSKQMRLHVPDILGPELFQMFLKIGGFPFRVDLALKKDEQGLAASSSVFEDIYFYEINRRGLERTIALEVLARINMLGSSSVSYEGFSKALTVGRETARRYLDALGDAYLLATLSSYDTSKQQVSIKKDKKLIWIDPSLGELAYSLRQGELPSEDVQVEMAVGAELLRRYEARLFEGLSAPRNVFTWKSSSGKEIDFLVIDKSQKLVLPVEVKYQNSISDWDFQVIEKAFGKGMILTRMISRDRDKAKAIPVFDFLSKS